MGGYECVCVVVLFIGGRVMVIALEVTNIIATKYVEVPFRRNFNVVTRLYPLLLKRAPM